MRSVISAFSRLPRAHRNLSVAGAVALGVTVAAPALMPAAADDRTRPVAVRTVAWSTQSAGQAHGSEQAEQAALHNDAARQAREQATAQAQAQRERTVQEAASRAPGRERALAEKAYPADLDGWIREALDILQDKGIPGTYEGIHRNIIRESSGDPRAINLWDINAVNGIPSKGLLQVIDPTFQAYHVEGTSWDIYDPVANITAACNYAAHRYGSMDNVNSAY
ncbi:transglycosylase SLT domain-containing protein [Streptomyces olivoreticuli]|uniref:transglycosylase SLT domain-containing protein n=1 Tax=Streptomyces olivoreticuli TaxID=68246 RepID=UPI0026595564|nr:transglycosylase SLT domain-containing protein [Streptomyces olivoreticuli]WKK27285.1 transglycosylase SLT domain-containing protein [Streptomyces olivoreticuli]